MLEILEPTARVNDLLARYLITFFFLFQGDIGDMSGKTISHYYYFMRNWIRF